MGLFDGCMLASDYDGTLADSQGRIPDRVKDSLRYFIAEGGRFTVCTGRSVQGFHAFDATIMNAPVLCANGAVLYDYAQHETVFSYSVGMDCIRFLQTLTETFPFLCVEMYNTRNESFVYRPDLRTHLHLTRQQIPYHTVSGFGEVVFPLVKIMLGVGRERTAEVQSWLDTQDMGALKYIPNIGEYIEILHKDADKGRGLLHLADCLGIAHTRAFAVGDGANDVDMLTAAAVGFVAENGDSLAKQAGDVTVCSNDEGAVADAVSHIEKIVKSDSEENKK